MKKIGTIIASLIMLLCAVFVLAACGNKDNAKLPSSNYEKVQFAFNGVESSLKNSNSSKKLKSNYASTDSKMFAISYGVPLLKLMANSVNSDDISTIYNAMSVEKETSNPSFEYDEPPMIQFQYLKDLYEEVGEDFTFGTKYTYNLTGSVYYDFENRVATESAEFLQQYSFDLSIKINIDENDLISAIVGFDITYTNGGISRNQKRYAELILDYDMNETSPTYELTMIDIDDLLSFESDDEKYISAEYDYVNVEKNTIKEWRKFGVCSPNTLANYQDNDYIYKYSVLRAFKDNKLFKATNSFNKNINLKNAVLGLGFIDALTSRDAFNRESGQDNNKIQVVVNKFNNILGKDFVNSFIYTGATEEWADDREPEPENLFLRIESTGGYQVYQDIKLDDLFNPNIGWDEKGIKQYLTIYYKNGEDNTLATYNNFNDFNVKVRSTYDKAKWIDVDNNDIKTITNYIEQSGFKGYYDEDSLEYTSMSLELDMFLKSNSNVKLQSTITLDLYNSDCYKALLKKWSLANNYLNDNVPVKDAIPEFESDSVYFSPNVHGNLTNGSIGLYFSSGLQTLINNYINKLKSLGFSENYAQSTYSKRISDEYMLILTIYGVSEKNPNEASILFEFKKSDKSDKTISDVINELINNENITIPNFDGDYEYTVEDGVIRSDGLNYQSIDDYIQSLSDYGFVISSRDGYPAACKYLDNKLYYIRGYGERVIKVEVVEVNISLVGDFNDWNENDTTYDINNFTGFSDSNVFLSIDIEMEANQALKIVKDHSWSDGGYGFNLFAGSDHFAPEYYSSGENNSIVVLEAGAYKVSVRIDISMGSPIIIMIDMQKIS